jgi:hypothetical protein
MDSPDEVAAAIEELAQEGFERDQIFVLCGPKGAERLDVSGRHHGLRGRLYRFAEHFGGEREHLARNAEHLGAGGLTISVPADEEKKSTVARILGRNGGHEMTHYGKGHWEHISP